MRDSLCQMLIAGDDRVRCYHTVLSHGSSCALPLPHTLILLPDFAFLAFVPRGILSDHRGVQQGAVSRQLLSRWVFFPGLVSLRPWEKVTVYLVVLITRL